MLPALYAILDPDVVCRRLLHVAEVLVDAGVELIQLRDKHGSARRIYSEAVELVQRFASSRIRVIVNDRPDIARMAGAGGVHVGQDDLLVEDARSIMGMSPWVGISTHNVAQVRDADRTSADYVAVGPIFATVSKDNPDPVVGLEFIRMARRLTRKPLVAIGGITVESAADVFAAGADSIAVVRDLLAAPDPAKRAREYLDIGAQVRSHRK